MKKVDGVESVRISLKDGLTILELKPGNTVTLAKLRTIIKNNGFVPKEAAIVAAGRTTDASTFQVSGTNEALPLSAAPQETADHLWKLTVRP